MIDEPPTGDLATCQIFYQEGHIERADQGVDCPGAFSVFNGWIYTNEEQELELPEKSGLIEIRENRIDLMRVKL